MGFLGREQPAPLPPATGSMGSFIEGIWGIAPAESEYGEFSQKNLASGDANDHR